VWDDNIRERKALSANGYKKFRPLESY
jgi:hypothetical protein